MEEKINLDDIIWFETNAIWLYQIIQEYIRAGKGLGMNYLSLSSLRYNEKYFVGYIYHKNNLDFSIELVSYIQYKMIPSKLTLNYMETAEKYRGNGIAKKTIDVFVNKMMTNPNIPVDVTTLSYDGRSANLMGKLQEKLTGEIIETSKRNTR